MIFKTDDEIIIFIQHREEIRGDIEGLKTFGYTPTCHSWDCSPFTNSLTVCKPYDSTVSIRMLSELS